MKQSEVATITASTGNGVNLCHWGQLLELEGIHLEQCLTLLDLKEQQGLWTVQAGCQIIGALIDHDC
jgi:hypothetical protein